MKKLIHLIVLLFSLESLSAQIIAGSEIYYKRTSNRTYKITAVVYRACNSSSLNNIDGWVINGSNKQNLPFTRTSITKINDTCGQPCQNINNFSNPGYEKHVFESNLNLNDNTYRVFLNQCNIHVAIFQNGRDGNVSTQNTGKYYNEATINICDSTINNHSPIFSMEPKFHMSVNNPLSYSPGPQDTTDYDSLAFSIEPVLTDYNTSIGYKTGYSYLIPLTPYCPPNPGVTNCRALPNAKPPRGFYFDPQLCTIIFTPTSTGEKGYIRIKIREFRKINNNWIELGSVSRDFRSQTIVTPDNNLPYFELPSSSTNLSTFCTNKLTFKITAKDNIYLPKQTVNDSTTILYDYGFNPSDFKASTGLREMTGDFTLYDDGSGISKTKYFTVAAYDKKCNTNLITKTFKTITRPTIDFTSNYYIDSCNVLTTELKLKDTTLNYSASTYVSGPHVTPIKFNQFQLNGDGRYLVYNNLYITQYLCNATQIDTIDLINSMPKAVLSQQKDTAICSSAPIKLSFSPGTIKDIASWKWLRNDTIVNSIDSLINDTFYQFNEYKLIVQNKKGCYSYNKVIYSAKSTKNSLFPNNKIQACPGYTFDVVPNDYMLRLPATYYWTYDTFSFPTTPGKIIIQLENPDTQQYLRLVIKDDNHCRYEDSMFIETFQSPKFKVVTNKAKICEGEPYTLKISNIKNNKVMDVIWKTPTSIGQYNNKDSISFPFASAKTFFVTLIDSNYCYDYDTFEFKPISHPVVKITPLKDICTGDQLIATAKITNPELPSISWYYNHQLIKTQDTFLQFNPNLGGKITIVVGNDNYCFASDSSNFKTEDYPKITIIGDTVYNYRNLIELSGSSNYNNYFWSNNYAGKSQKIWAYSLGQPGTYSIWVSSSNNLGCRSYDTITFRTNGFTEIKPFKSQDLKVYPNPVKDVLNIESNETIEVTIGDYSGRILKSFRVTEGLNRIDVSALAQGLYYIRLGENISTFTKQ